MSPSTDPTDLEALQLAYHRLQQQYQALAAFLGTASHELRAPINRVISLHQLILEDLCESPEEEREFIGQANQAITRMLHNLDTLINLSKLDLGTLSPVFAPRALGTVLNQVRQFTEMQCINRQCRLTVNLGSNNLGSNNLGPNNLGPNLPGAEALRVLSDDRWLLQALISLVEAALAAGSTAITLEPSALNHQTVTLQFTCNAPAPQWPPTPPPPLPTADADPNQPNGRTERTEPSPLGSLTPLSPSFRYHLAHRILGHLGSTIHTAAKAADGTHGLTIRMPVAGAGCDAS